MAVIYGDAHCYYAHHQTLETSIKTIFDPKYHFKIPQVVKSHEKYSMLKLYEEGLNKTRSGGNNSRVVWLFETTDDLNFVSTHLENLAKIESTWICPRLMDPQHTLGAVPA